MRSTKKHPPGWRAVLIGALLIVPGFYFGTYSYLIVQALGWRQTSLQMGGPGGPITWVLKSLALRYGGIKVYHRLVPLFIGLILGDFVTAGLWGLYGTIVGQRMYMFFPH